MKDTGERTASIQRRQILSVWSDVSKAAGRNWTRFIGYEEGTVPDLIPSFKLVFFFSHSCLGRQYKHKAWLF